MKLLSNIWNGYKSFARKIGIFQSKVILTVFYLLLTPFGLFFAFFKDDLKIKKILPTSWIKKDKQAESMEDLLRQY